MALPIQKIPILVIHLILQNMRFLDIFLLTRTSTKMKRIVQIMNTTPKQNLSKKTNLTGAVDTYWKDTKAGCIKLCNELVEVFRTPVKGVTLDLDEIENYRNEIRWINSTFPALTIFTIKGKCSFQDYMWMIRNSRATEALYFEMKPTRYPDNMENLEVDFSKLETLVIDHGRWVSLQQLQAVNASYISIKDADLTDFEINAFLRSLESSGEKPKFEELHIFFYDEADADIILEGLNFEDGDDSKQENIFGDIVFKTGSGQKCTISYSEFDDEGVALYGFEIRIKD
ncbi:unnamed protein product [Caenorhabditis brenneri]